MKAVNLQKMKDTRFYTKRERERERRSVAWPGSLDQASILNFFQFATKHGESAVIFTADFLFSKFMMGDPKIRLPYKEDNDDNSYTVDPEKEEGLEDKDDESEEQTEP